METVNSGDKIIFRVKLADVPIGISAFYDTTRQFCRKYLTEEQPVLQLEIIPEDLLYEEQKAIREAQLNHLGDVRYPYAYLETLAVYRKIAEGLLPYGIVLLHGSVVAVDGAAYLFAAASGTGKSTHTRLWRELFGDRAVMVNDDKPLLRVTDGGVTVYGTPWNGKHRIGNNVAFPLKAICILERDKENHIEEIDRRQAWPLLMQQSYRPREAAGLRRTLDLIDAVSKKLRLYRLGCNMDISAAATAFEGMRQTDTDGVSPQSFGGKYETER